jgi:predicted NBD/HSP70 family sugar kinase
VSRVGEQAGGRGPNAALYAVVPTSAFVVGVEIGPQHAVAACADVTGNVVSRVQQSTHDTDDPVGVVHNAVIEAARSAKAPISRVRRVVLGTPGLVDPATGDRPSRSTCRAGSAGCSRPCARTSSGPSSSKTT